MRFSEGPPHTHSKERWATPCLCPPPRDRPKRPAAKSHIPLPQRTKTSGTLFDEEEEGRNRKEKAAGEEIYSSRMQVGLETLKWASQSRFRYDRLRAEPVADPAVSQIMGLDFSE